MHSLVEHPCGDGPEIPSEVGRHRWSPPPLRIIAEVFDDQRHQAPWGGWVAWAPADEETDQVDELWGEGFFLGAYPVKDGIGVFLGCPDSREPLGARRFAAEVRSKLTTLTPRINAALTAVAEADDPYFWALRDFRSAQWAASNTILLGDAAAGFLPTAGIGAGMSMESHPAKPGDVENPESANVVRMAGARTGHRPYDTQGTR